MLGELASLLLEGAAAWLRIPPRAHAQALVPCLRASPARISCETQEQEQVSHGPLRSSPPYGRLQPPSSDSGSIMSTAPSNSIQRTASSLCFSKKSPPLVLHGADYTRHFPPR